MSNNNINKHNEINVWKGRFFQLNEYLSNYTEDASFIHKVKELAAKSTSRELTIAFCGHFSAGKSSMINRLMGDDLLPASPIPTSANIVAIKYGEPRVMMTDQQGKKLSYSGELNLEQVKKASKNGEEIKTIEIFKQHPFLEDDTVVMDTPGIDSVDDAHRVSTESMLHLADVIVYVMDYNHVQSELNFNFTKEMQDLGKEVYLVINQIDKHVENELSFDDYRNQTINAFEQWGVQASGIYFTSLRNEQHLHSQLDDLENELKSIKLNKTTFINQTLESMTSRLIDEFLEKKYPNIDAEDSGHKVEVEKISALKKRKKELEDKKNQIEKEFMNELKKLIENARIAPYEVRELGRAVLESMKEDFKSGIFFARKKTEEERNLRVGNYVEAVNEKVSTELDWHIKQELQKQLNQLKVHDPSIQERVHEIEHRFSEDDVFRLQQKGATFNEAYVLQYNRDVEDDLKKRYRRSAIDVFTSIKTSYIKASIEPEIKKIEREQAELNELSEKQIESQAILEQYNQEQMKLMNIIHDESLVPEADAWIDDVRESLHVHSEEGTWEADEVENRQPSTVSEKGDYPEKDLQVKTHLEEAANQLDESIKLLSKWPSLEDLTSRMKDRSDKIKDKQYTVALFGAFSAGKSSFANAWLKNNVLPVSPNPTTATINKILPVTDQYPHGTVKIELKSEEVILEELNHSLSRFDKHCDSLHEAIDVIQEVTSEKPDPHYNFIKAVEKGYEAMKEYLGSDQLIDHESFAGFVAQEDRACFTESVELYYDCELTRQGIILVDTPGADSINARHTSVAFDYIKNADAIVFVTYYNHAFSKADRDFLVQLGRVKDTFAMDKMYFVINAADLAKDEEERDAVVDYVTEQLTQYGIRFPRMYPVSSKQALYERMDNTQDDGSGFGHFEQSFEETTIKERDEVSVTQAFALMKSGHSRLSEWIDHAQSDEEHQEREKKRLQTEKMQIVEHIDNYSVSSLQKSLSQETHELLHYVVQRLMFTFNDEYKFSFNPSVLTQKSMNHHQLKKCLEELLESMRFQLSQELRATTLRLEKQLDIQRNRFYEMAENYTADRSSCKLMGIREMKVETPFIDPEWPSSTMATLDPSLKKAKNAKQFFEGNGKEVVREELADRFEPILGEVIESYTDEFIQFYNEALKNEIDDMKKQTVHEIEQYYTGVLEAFASKDRLDELIETKEQMESIIFDEKEAKNEG